jgi:tRNA pseudouridine38-40 synthase
MTRFRIVLSYDGTDYVGWQRQASGVSIQGLIEEALRALDGRDVTVSGAGRTDAGVHALGQVAGFTLERSMDPATLVRALNAQLPYAVRVLDAAEVGPDFHPRFSARVKTYRYRLWNGEVMSPFERAYAWHVRGRLDVEAMRAAAPLIRGRHDFAAFQAAGGSVTATEREVLESTLQASGPGSSFAAPAAVLTYEVTGTGFLRHMVRIIVGSLVEIGRGRQPIEWMSDAIASRDRQAAGPTAPPQGLVLVRVEYPSALAAGS